MWLSEKISAEYLANNHHSLPIKGIFGEFFYFFTTLLISIPRAGLVVVPLEYQMLDNTVSIADTKALACATTLSIGRRRALAGNGAA